MTASATNPYVAYVGAGLTGPYAVPFKFLANTDLVVIKIDAAGAETPLTGNMITGAGDADGGELYTAAAVAVGETLQIYRTTVRAQTAQYVANGPFPAATHERALDKAMLIDQEQDRDQARALRARMGETLALLPKAADRASKFLGFDVNGNPIATDETLVGVPALASAIGYYPPGGGSVRAVSDRLDDQVSIYNFRLAPENLVGGNAAAFTAAFNRAIAYLNLVGGRRLEIPAPANGLPWLLNAVTIDKVGSLTDSIIIQGEGAASVIAPGSACVDWITIKDSFFVMEDLLLQDINGLVSGYGIVTQKVADNLPMRFRNLIAGGFSKLFGNRGVENVGIEDVFTLNVDDVFTNEHGGVSSYIERLVAHGCKNGVILDATVTPSVAVAEGFRLSDSIILPTQAGGCGVKILCALLLKIRDTMIGQVGANGIGIDIDATVAFKAATQVFISDTWVEGGTSGLGLKVRGNVSDLHLARVTFASGGGATNVSGIDMADTIRYSLRDTQTFFIDGADATFANCSGLHDNNNWTAGTGIAEDAACAIRWLHADAQGLPVVRRPTSQYPLASGTNYTPTISTIAGSVTTGAVAARYVRDGRMVDVFFDLPVNLVTGAIGALVASLPPGLPVAAGASWPGCGREGPATGRAVTVVASGSSAAIRYYDNSVPPDGATNLRFFASVRYETSAI